MYMPSIKFSLTSTHKSHVEVKVHMSYYPGPAVSVYNTMEYIVHPAYTGVWLRW